MSDRLRDGWREGQGTGSPGPFVNLIQCTALSVGGSVLSFAPTCLASLRKLARNHFSRDVLEYSSSSSSISASPASDLLSPAFSDRNLRCRSHDFSSVMSRAQVKLPVPMSQGNDAEGSWGEIELDWRCLQSKIFSFHLPEQEFVGPISVCHVPVLVNCPKMSILV